MFQYWVVLSIRVPYELPQNPSSSSSQHSSLHAEHPMRTNRAMESQNDHTLLIIYLVDSYMKIQACFLQMLHQVKPLLRDL